MPPTIAYWYTTLILLAGGVILLRLAAPWRFSEPMIPAAEGALTRLEDSISLPGTAVVMGMIGLVAAMIYTHPRFIPEYLGAYYVLMAQHPFSTTSGAASPHRILTPLVSYLIGLRGRNIQATNTLVAWGVLTVTYWYFRTAVPRRVDALLAVFIMAFSGVTLNTLFYASYTDSTTLLLLFLIWWHRKRPVVFYGLILLGVFNHELVFFMFPWFVYLRLSEPGRPRWQVVLELIVGLALVSACYAAFRFWLSSREPVRFSLNYYLQPLLNDPFATFRVSGWYQVIGFFTVFKLLWVAPAVAFVSFLRSSNQRWAGSMLVLFLCTWAQLMFAYDASRLFMHGFLLMVIALVYLLRIGESVNRYWITGLLLASLLIPQWYTAASKVLTLNPLLGYIVSWAAK